MNNFTRFEALAKEAQFTREMLGSGATQIRRANYAQKGVYFQAFTSLSTGLERLGKLCLMLDYYIDNEGTFPNIKYLKNEIGHNILLLYKKCLAVAEKRSITFHFPTDLSGKIYQDILSVLSEFAIGDRYSNINILLSQESADPVASWFKNVDLSIFENKISEKKKRKIADNADIINHFMSSLTLVRHTSETGSEITDVREASFRTGLQEAVAPYRQLYMLQIIRFWVELIDSLQYSAMELDKQDIPFFSEIFAPFFNPDSYFKSRKTWDKL
jgi:hypothetical protein